MTSRRRHEKWSNFVPSPKCLGAPTMAHLSLTDLFRASDPERWLMSSGAHLANETEWITGELQSLPEPEPLDPTRGLDIMRAMQESGIKSRREQLNKLHDARRDKCLALIYQLSTALEKQYVVEAPADRALSEHQWLSDFNTINDFADSLAAFRKDSNMTTIVIVDYLESFAGTRLALKYQKRCNSSTTFPDHMTRAQRELESAEAFVLAVRDFKMDRSWHNVCMRVNDFCLRAGCLETVPNAFENMLALRKEALKLSNPNREAMLFAELQQLREKNQQYEEELNKQNRVIANLSFRHLLEHLPGPKPQKVSNTNHWKTFWETAVKHAVAENAAARKANTTSTHPLEGLLRRFGSDQRSIDQIIVRGKDMYSTLSTNIHHFRGVYSVDQNQWDTLPGAILHSLAPNNFDSEGGVDWGQELSRY